MFQYEYLMDLVNATNGDGYCYLNDNIYIKLNDNNIDPNTIQFDIARYKDGFVPKSNTYFYNLNFINYGESKYSQSIYIEYADNIYLFLRGYEDDADAMETAQDKDIEYKKE